MAIAVIPDDESSSQMAEEYLQSKGLVLLLPCFLISFPKIQHHVLLVLDRTSLQMSSTSSSHTDAQQH